MAHDTAEACSGSRHALAPIWKPKTHIGKLGQKWRAAGIESGANRANGEVLTPRALMTSQHCIHYDVVMRCTDQPTTTPPSVEEQIEAVRAETWRIHCEQMSQRKSIVDKPWFPWVALPTAMALGPAAVALIR